MPITFFCMAGAGMTWRERLFVTAAWSPKATVQVGPCSTPPLCGFRQIGICTEARTGAGMINNHQMRYSLCAHPGHDLEGTPLRHSRMVPQSHSPGRPSMRNSTVEFRREVMCTDARAGAGLVLGYWMSCSLKYQSGHDLEGMPFCHSRLVPQGHSPGRPQMHRPTGKL